ncbi:MAG: heme-binding domain-containing protein [Planctomycetota bacterium]|jgi:hypothetical protein
MRTKTKNVWKIVGLVLGLGLLGIQAWPVDRSNPEVTGDIKHMGGAPDNVHAILRRACYDCHSFETNWPWYAYVAPLSWWVADHVHEGRKELNFSIWDQYSDGVRSHKLREAWEQIDEGEMPLNEYLWTHADAAVTQADRAVLEAWIKEVAPPRTRRTDDGDDSEEDGDDD